jgi:hypothetical protein
MKDAPHERGYQMAGKKYKKPGLKKRMINDETADTPAPPHGGS